MMLSPPLPSHPHFPLTKQQRAPETAVDATESTVDAVAPDHAEYATTSQGTRYTLQSMMLKTTEDARKNISVANALDSAADETLRRSADKLLVASPELDLTKSKQQMKLQRNPRQSLSQDAEVICSSLSPADEILGTSSGMNAIGTAFLSPAGSSHPSGAEDVGGDLLDHVDKVDDDDDDDVGDDDVYNGDKNDDCRDDYATEVALLNSPDIADVKFLLSDRGGRCVRSTKKRRRLLMERAGCSADEARRNRAAAIERLRVKKRLRSFDHKVRYACRKKIALVRPRINGRFATKEEVREAARMGFTLS
jgi:hypothetical protein